MLRTEPRVVLAPTDFSEHAEVGLRHAAAAARAHGARLVVMVNLNLPERALLEEDAETLDAGAATAAAHRIADTMARLAPDLEVAALVTEHDTPASGVLWAIDEVDAELVVMASHGRTGVGRWLLGSVADKVVHAAPVPVTVVPVRGG